MDREEIRKIVEEAREEQYQENDIIVIGNGTPLLDHQVKMLREVARGVTFSVCYSSDSFDMWPTPARLEKETPNWKQSKLRKGSGHTKHKRKGKK